jgi:hypothetical protein
MDESKEELMSWEFTNLPRKHSREDYKEVLENVARCYVSDDLVAIYDWGAPGQPGISDVDVLLVWKNSPQPLPLKKRSFAFLDKKSRYLLRHPPMHISEDDFPFIPYIYPDGRLRKVTGRLLNVKQLSKAEKVVVRKAVFNDIVIRHYPRDVLQQSVEKNINVRDVLLRLKSLGYTFKTMDYLGLKTEKPWKEFESRVKLLRKRWFWNGDKKSLIQLTTESVDIMMDIIERGKAFFPLAFQLAGQEEVRYTGIKNSTVFLTQWEKPRALEHMQAILRKTGKPISVLPMEYASQLVQYSQFKGRISEQIKNHLRVVFYELQANPALGKRIAVLNGQAELAARLRHSDFPAFFDFGYRNTRGINNALLRIADKLRF